MMVDADTAKPSANAAMAIRRLIAQHIEPDGQGGKRGEHARQEQPRSPRPTSLP